MEQTNPTPTGFQPPSAPTPNIVVVTNIASTTSEKSLREFFSFCGEIEELHLIAQYGDSQKAIIRFNRESAARTALLLSNAYLGEKTILVAPYFDDLPPYVNRDLPFDPNQKETTELRQEDKPKLSIVVELLANGYVLNDKVIDGAKSFDEKYGVSNTFQSYLNSAKGVASNIDSTYHVSEKIHNVSEDIQKKAGEIDEKYHVSETVGAATTSAKNLAENAISSEAGQKVQGFLMDVWNKAKVINEEARKKAFEKEGQAPIIPEPIPVNDQLTEKDNK